MVSITMKQLLEAGVHFGHQTKRWNPKMKEYIFGQRNGIYIIDLQKSIKLFKNAIQFMYDLGSRGKTILFLGTKRHSGSRAEDIDLLCESEVVRRTAHQFRYDTEKHQTVSRTGNHAE